MLKKTQHGKMHVNRTLSFNFPFPLSMLVYLRPLFFFLQRSWDPSATSINHFFSNGCVTILKSGVLILMSFVAASNTYAFLLSRANLRYLTPIFGNTSHFTFF